MCGISGFQSKNLSCDRNYLINSMLDTIEYRGPDDRGIYLDGDITLGHVRLSIIDIAHGKQPMSTPDGMFTIIFNGEIYNYLELRQQLTQAGYKLQTFSDTEVLLYMYAEYGSECVKYLNGMFAFAVYNSNDKTLFLARDHFGIKPLYYYCDNENYIFASEIKSILKHPAVKKEVDWHSVNEYLTFQLMLKKHTMFKNIHQLEPATSLMVRNGKIINKKKYWEINYEIDESKTIDEFADELLVLLESSLSIQMRSDVPVGAYVSGGLDSSSVAVLASKNSFGKFKTFTGAFHEGTEFDETAYSSLLSKKINSEHYTIYPTPVDFVESFEKLVYYMDYPSAGPGIFPQYMVSKLARDHVKVVLGGQGGDEIFGGYTRYAVAYLEQCIKGAIFQTQEEGKHVVTLSSIIPNMPQLKQYIPLIKEQFKDGLFDPMDERYFRMINRSHNLKTIFNNDWLAQFNKENLLDKFKQVFNVPKTKSYFNKMTHFDTYTLLPALLHVEDRVSMAVSLESRVPLLDYRIVELSAKIPPTMKFAGGKTKAMLVETVKNILPKEIINRTDKMGFPTPLNKWLAGPLKEFSLDILTSQKSRSRGLINISAIEKQINESGNFNRDLWGALNLEMWFRVFID